MILVLAADAAGSVGLCVPFLTAPESVRNKLSDNEETIMKLSTFSEPFGASGLLARGPHVSL